MRTVIYGDVLFLVNFSMDVFALYLCGLFLDMPRRARRLVPAALLGGLYGVAALIPVFTWWGALAAHLAVSILLCWLAYGTQTGRVFLRLFVCFYLTSVLLGGAVDALYSLLGNWLGAASLSVGAAFSEKKAGVFLLYAGISGVAVLLGGRVFRRTKSEKTVMLRIREGKREARVRALVDSGNLLRDPFSGRAVILVRAAAIAPLGLPPTVLRTTGASAGVETDIAAEQARKMRVLVVHGVGGAKALVAYLPDGIAVYDEKTQTTEREIDALIAVDAERKRDFAGCGAILPTTLAGG